MTEDERLAMHERNFAAFAALPDSVYEEHEDEVALVVDGEVRRYFATYDEACRVAHRFEPSGRYSLQEVRREPYYVGCF